MSIIVDNISYTYEIGTGFEKQALKNVKCVINDGDFIGLIGHTGSGKSILYPTFERTGESNQRYDLF